jgi:TatD DNase family protein
MELIDTHCHLDVEEFDADRAEVLQRCRAVGVTRQVIPGYTCERWNDLLRVCRQHEGLYPALGLHPVYTDRHQPDDLQNLEGIVADEPLVAIGEVGLDYYIDNPDIESQQSYFEAQIAIAETAGLPLLLHIRKANDEVWSTLRRLGFSHGGIAHAFSGSIEQAQRLVDLGFAIGIGGTLTYDRAKRVRRVAAELPLSALVLETDAPDIPMAGHDRNVRNSPEYLPEVLDALAMVRSDSKEQLAIATTANAQRIFGDRLGHA